MPKLTLNSLTSLVGIFTPLNANFDAIETEFDKVLYRDGTAPNGMLANFDMNNYRITNLAAPVNNSDAVRKVDLDNLEYSVSLTALNTAVSDAQAAQAATETAETNAVASAIAAQTAQTGAETAKANAEAALTSFRSVYLGAQSSDPSVDLNGNSVGAGDFYFSTDLNVLRVYDGSSWTNAPQGPPGVAGVYNTVADVQAATVDADINFIRTNAYASTGGKGGALYKRAASEPSHPGKIQDASGAWFAIVESTLTPQMFGATTGTAADQASFISNMFDTADAIGSNVYFPAGNWRQDTPISKTYGLEIKLHPEAIIDCRSMANSSTAWTFSGSYGTAYSIAGNFFKGGTTVTVSTSDAANFAFGDYVIIRSSNIFDASNTNTKIGEINRVQSVDTGTGVITLASPLQGTYTSTPLIEKPTFIRGAKIQGGRFLSEDGADNLDSAKAGIKFVLAQFPSIIGVRFDRFDDRAGFFLDCYAPRFDYCEVHRARSSGETYAVSFADCTQDGGAAYNYFEGVRRSLSTNNWSARGGIVRRITFAHNRQFISAEAVSPGSGGGVAIDTHGAAEDIKIIGNTVIGATGLGINVECPSVEVFGNTVIGSSSHGICVHNEADIDGTAVIANNVVRGAGGQGIYLYNGTRGTTAVYRSSTVQGNVVSESTGAGIQINASSSLDMTGLALVGNSVRAGSARGLDIYGCNECTIANNVVKGISGQTTVSILNCRNYNISGNIMTQPSGSSSDVFIINATSAADTTCGIIAGNRCGPESSTMTGYGISLSSNVQYTGLFINNVHGSGGISASGHGNYANLNIY